MDRTPLRPGEACYPNAVCWRAPSHEWDHDRFALSPSSNQLCYTCASSSDSTARGASHGKCYANKTGTVLLNLTVTPLLSPTLVLADQVIRKNYRHFHTTLLSPLATAWKHQKTNCHGWRYHPPRKTAPCDKKSQTRRNHVHYHLGTLDTARPQETTSGDQKSKPRNNYLSAWFLTSNTVFWFALLLY